MEKDWHLWGVGDWFEWTNLYFQIPLAVLGFGIAFWQIWNAKKAAEAAKDAAESAEGAVKGALTNFKSQSASALIPQLLHLEDIIDAAVKQKSVELLSHALQNWRWQAPLCRELLDNSEQDEQHKLERIQRSTTAASRLKQQMITFDDSTDWIAVTKSLRGAVGRVAEDLNVLSAKLAVRESN